MKHFLGLLEAIKFRKYKSFNNETGYIRISMKSLFTVIIGRNNCGKSSVVDVIERVINESDNSDIVDLNIIMNLSKELMDIS